MPGKKLTFSLGQKTRLMVIIIAVSVCLVLNVFSYTHYRKEMYDRYEDFAMNIGAIAASRINPDKIEHYIETCEKDEEYEETLSLLCDIQQNGGVRYL